MRRNELLNKQPNRAAGLLRRAAGDGLMGEVEVYTNAQALLDEAHLAAADIAARIATADGKLGKLDKAEDGARSAYAKAREHSQAKRAAFGLAEEKHRNLRRGLAANKMRLARLSELAAHLEALERPDVDALKSLLAAA